MLPQAPAVIGAKIPRLNTVKPHRSSPAAALARSIALNFSAPRYSLALLLGALLAAPGGAQTTGSPAAPAPKLEETVELSPFVVNSSQNTGYQAASTLAGTRLNTDLKDVGAAVSVYTPEFLEDINVTKIEDILTYTASTEGGGMNGNFSGISGDSSAGVREDPSSVNRVRDQSHEHPIRASCDRIRFPYCSFHSQMRWTRPSRPTSCRVLFSFSLSCFSTTACVAIPA